MMDDRTHPIRITSTNHAIRWGTVTLEPEATVKICIGSPNADPILLHLAHQTVLGRSEENPSNVQIDLATYGAAEKGVSRLHASLERVAKTVRLTDLNSTNGTFLNGQRVLPNERRVVRDGDEIRLGQLLLYIFYEKPYDSDVEARRYGGINRYTHDTDSPS